MLMNDNAVILASFLGGMLPAILWLEFWLREARHHEPRRLIVGTFLLGMFSVIIAGVLERSVTYVFIEFTTISFFLWALIEELVKFAVAYAVGIRSRFCDDPIDPSLYLITSALGFAAAENMLFLHDALVDGGIGRGLASIVDRFVGASLLHVITACIVGISIGFSFWKSAHAKRIAIYIGLFIAVLLHTAFNRFIIEGDGHRFWVFSSTWIGLVVVILILEKIKNAKKIKRTS